MNYRILLCVALFMFSFYACETEKTEYHQVFEAPNFYGFYPTNMRYIVHDKSIDIYSPDSNKVYLDIYYRQNGKSLGNKIHSFKQCNANTGIISVEGDDRVEFVDMKNFTSEGSVELENPRDIEIIYIDSYFSFALISFGKGNNGGLAVILLAEKNIIKTVETGNEPGKILVDGNFIYVMSTGENNDYSIAKIFFDMYETHKVDDIVIGPNPVDFVTYYGSYGDYQHQKAAIFCKGNQAIPASIITYDLITGKSENTYSFAGSGLVPESISYGKVLPGYYFSELTIFINANKKLYRADIAELNNASLFIDKDISPLIWSEYEGFNTYYIAISRDTVNEYSYLYRFLDDYNSLGDIPVLTDSIKIEGYAKGIE